ncbi:hypothetical protein PRIC2_007629 [Phytophthora ramorum]
MLQLFNTDNPEVPMTERYQHAIDAVDAGMYIREAAERFGVTRESLRLRIRGVVPLSCRRGPQLVYISDEADAGLPLSAAFGFGVFQPYKALYNAAVRDFPLQGEGLPVKDDVARMACGPFETAFSSANVRRGFRDSGIFPLSLEVMLQKMVGGGTTGKERSSTILVRHHAVLEPHFNGEIVSKRVQAGMKRRRLRLSLSMLIEPAVRPRPKGDFVDANVSGGKLLTYKEMEPSR